MKKNIGIGFAIIGILIVIMSLIPGMFKNKLAQKIKLEINKNINAKVEFSDIELSLFRSFPQLNITINKFAIEGVANFNQVPLLNIEALYTSVNLSSLWNNSDFQITSLKFINPIINLKVSKEGISNWSIFKTQTQNTSSSEKKPNNINLESIKITNGSLSYKSEASPLEFSFTKGNLDLSGALKGSNSTLKINGEADSIKFQFNGSNYISQLKAKFTGGLKSDFDQMYFTLLQNELIVNQLPLTISGTFILGEKADNYDLTFKSPASSLKDLLGLVPAQYQAKLKNVESSGAISFEGFVKGAYQENSMPSFGVDLKVSDGRIKYPKLTKSLDKIDVTASLTKPQGSMDLMKIDLKKFIASVDDNLISGSLNVITPVSNPEIDGLLKAHINLGVLKQVFPIDSIDVSGNIEGYVKFNGQYASIEKGEYEKFKTEGKVTLDNFTFSHKLLPQKLEISKAQIEVNAKAITLTSLAGKAGESDFTATGNLTNYWPFVLKNGILNGAITLNSNYLNLNQFIPTSNPKDSILTGKPFEVPEKFNISLQAKVNKILYDKISILNTSGEIKVQERRVQLNNLKMNMLNGTISVSGAYLTPKEGLPNFDFKLNISDFDLPTAYQSSGTIRHFLPIANQSTGSFNTGISLNGSIGKGNTPIFKTVNGEGNISTRNIALIGTGLFTDISKYFKQGLFSNVKVNDFDAKFKIVEGGLIISPFNTKIAGQDVTISGKQSVSMDLDYIMNFKVSKNSLSEQVNGYIGFVPGAENIDKYPIGILLTGTFDKPIIKVELTEAKNLVEKEFKKKAGTVIQDAIKKFGLDKLFK